MRPSRSTRRLLAALTCVLIWHPSVAETPANPDAFRLDERKQRAIWDGEHVTFKIENHVGKPLLQWLRGGEANEIDFFFR